MNKKKLIGLSLAFFATLSFSGCGDSSSDDSESPSSTNVSTGDSSSSTSGSSVSSVVPYSCQITSANNGKTVEMKLGANGKLTCDDSYGYPQLKFIDGVNEMIISQAIISYEINTNSAIGKSTVDLKKGTETIVVTKSKDGIANCVNTYDISLPISFYDAEMFDYFDIEDYQQISTTCPSWVNDDADDEEDDNYDGLITENTTITETSGDISQISRYISIN